MKFISDGSDKNVPNDWNVNMVSGAPKLLEAYLKLKENYAL